LNSSFEQEITILKKIKPASFGKGDISLKWVDQYGDALVCVRYKYDEEKRKRMTTIELIVDEKCWNADEQGIPKNRMMNLRVDYGEIDVARLVKAAGGKRNKSAKVWELPYKDVLALGLSERI